MSAASLISTLIPIHDIYEIVYSTIRRVEAQTRICFGLICTDGESVNTVETAEEDFPQSAGGIQFLGVWGPRENGAGSSHPASVTARIAIICKVGA